MNIAVPGKAVRILGYRGSLSLSIKLVLSLDVRFSRQEDHVSTLTGADWKQQMRDGKPSMGLFLNAHSPTVAEQLAHSGYDWLLVDTQHGPMGYEKLSGMLAGISNGGAKSLVRVGGYSDRPGIQQALDMGADGVLVPYINSAEEEIGRAQV